MTDTQVKNLAQWSNVDGTFFNRRTLTAAQLAAARADYDLLRAAAVPQAKSYYMALSDDPFAPAIMAAWKASH